MALALLGFLSFLDWGVLVGFFLVVIAVSMFKSRRETDSESYFLAGRGLTWPLIGLSIVAANISTEQFVGMAGQGAGATGLAVSAWQLTGSVGIVLIAFTLLPKFLRAGIYTMPEYLEYRYNGVARALMALTTVVIYAAVLLTAVLYSGGVTLRAIFDIPLYQGVIAIGVVAAVYTTWGGLKAVAWADLFLGLGLLIGGLITFALGLDACGGWEHFTEVNEARLHMILPADHPELPWTGIVAGMWIVIIYYCGLNQFIVQRNLAAKTLRDGQLGVIFAGALWLLVPFAIVMPGIMALQLYGDQLATPDEAFPTLIKSLIPSGMRGFMLAAIAGAIISSLASMLNSASTIFTMDVYRRLIDPHAPQGRLVWIGRVMTLVFVGVGMVMAASLENWDRFAGVFRFIQQFQGYIWPGVVAAFLMAFVLKRAPGAAGVAALITGPTFYGMFQYLATPVSEHAPAILPIHYLVQVLLSFLLVCLVMAVITIVAPLKKPRTLPVREDLDVRTSPISAIAGALVIAGVVVFVWIFR